MRRDTALRAGIVALAAVACCAHPALSEVRSLRLDQEGADFAAVHVEHGPPVRSAALSASSETFWVSAVLDTGLAFSAIGPHWQAAQESAVEVRVSPDGVVWGRWIAVPREGTIDELREDGEPNPFAGDALGALVFVDPSSRFLQYRVGLHGGSLAAAGLRRISFHVIDPGPAVPRPEAEALREATPPPAPLSPPFSVAKIFPRAPAPPPEAPAGVAAPKPRISLRAAWGARPPKAAYSYTLAGHVAIHHTATVEDWAAESWDACAARMRAIQTYHMDANGWNDIGYAWVICKHGDVFQAREDDDDTTDVQGAHDGLNKGSTGISVMGYFHPPVDHTPTDAQLSSLVDLIAWIASVRGIDPLGRSVYEQFGAPVDNVYGHREVKATDCPGDRLFARKEAIRASVAERVLRLAW